MNPGPDETLLGIVNRLENDQKKLNEKISQQEVKMSELIAQFEDMKIENTLLKQRLDKYEGLLRSPAAQQRDDGMRRIQAEGSGQQHAGVARKRIKNKETETKDSEKIGVSKDPGAASLPSPLASESAPASRDIQVTTIRIGCWNVKGLKRHLEDESFNNYIQQFHLLGLVETMLKKNSPVDIPGYSSINRYTGRKATRGRTSGGVTLLYRNDLLFQVEEVKVGLSSIAALRVLQGVKTELIVMVLYRHSSRSKKYYNPRYLTTWGNVINTVKRKYKRPGLIVLGDFNTRIGEMDVAFTTDTDGQPRQVRRSEDKYPDDGGSKLIEICNEHKLEILNGKHGRDTMGKVTFISSNKGSSVIDYAICSHDMLSSICDFLVDEQINSSDHRPLVVDFDLRLA